MAKDINRASHKTRIASAAENFEKGERRTSRAEYILRLYVTGSSPRSLRAIHNLKKLCEEYLSGDYDLEVIDIREHPALAREEQIIAAPTLVKNLPIPLRKFVGDLSNIEKLLVGLDVYKRKKQNDA